MIKTIKVSKQHIKQQDLKNNWKSSQKHADKYPKIKHRLNLQFFNLFFKIGFMFLFNVGVSGILYLQTTTNSISNRQSQTN